MRANLKFVHKYRSCSRLSSLRGNAIWVEWCFWDKTSWGVRGNLSKLMHVEQEDIGKNKSGKTANMEHSGHAHTVHYIYRKKKTELCEQNKYYISRFVSLIKTILDLFGPMQTIKGFAEILWQFMLGLAYLSTFPNSSWQH